MLVNPPKNYVFDFGAVLFHWRPDHLLMEYFPQQVNNEALAREMGYALVHHADWNAFDRGEASAAETVDSLCERLQLPHAKLTQLVADIPERLTPMPDSLALLEQLRKRREKQGDVRLFFLSNMPAPYARYLEQTHAFLSWFDGGIFSCDVKLIKPDARIFALLEQRYGLEPSACVFIDDLLPNVEAARARGWQGVHFQSAAQAGPLISKGFENC